MTRAAPSDKSRSGNGPVQAASPWEWVVAVIGAALVAAAIGYLIYFALTTPAGPPFIAIEQGQVLRNGDGYVLTINVTNGGATTAAAVEIEGRLSRDGVELERATATLDYVPRLSNRLAGLYFAHDPRNADIELRALGYAGP